MVIEFGSLFEESISRKRISANENVTFIGMQDVDENATIQNYHDIYYSAVKSGFTYFEKGDVLVAKITPCFENGKGGYANNLPTRIGFGSTEFHILRAKTNVNPTYIYYISKTKKFRDLLESEMVGSAGHRRVPFSAIKKYELSVLHTYEEQTAIANALSNVDTLIVSIEKLIAKKQAIKTATMQQLLTGKKRLPPFDLYQKDGQDGTRKGQQKGTQQTELGKIPEDWDVCDFGSVVNYIKGYPFKSTEYTSDGVRIIRVSDTTYDSIHDRNPVYISDNAKKQYKKWILKENDLIFSTVGSKPPMYDSLVGKAILVPKRFDGSLLNQNAVLIRSKNYSRELQVLLLNHFRTERYIDYIEIIYRGNANQASITLENLFQFQIPLPSDNEEIKAISEMLIDMDEEIGLLEQRLIKTQEIKQGMMQELLTGKTRLV